uniref:Uncharacterized protein n=1 Tax=viral metagenome TaxID=1070528 RepID=A0A6C0JU24_9ZZZZ
MPHIESRKAFWFDEKTIESVEKKYGVKYIGYWCVEGANVQWASNPVDVFYQPNPNTELGHSNYFGIFSWMGEWRICNADSAFSVPITGILENGVVYVSRYRHDSVCTPNGNCIDGGRDYVNINKNASPIELVNVRVVDGEFIFEKRIEENDK